MAKKTQATDLFDSKGGNDGDKPVECLGLSFPYDEARRAYFTEKLREKLKDPAFRKIEGFPIGDDEDILALSDPPYYTACPNPFLAEIIRHNAAGSSQADAKREPFCTDVEEGKKDPIYNGHSYHTKVPHKAIMRYILHFTNPGDVVYDGFSGSGMTGVAAGLCGRKSAVEDLGYKVTSEGVVLDSSGQPISRLGSRVALLNDLSPAASYITYNNVFPPTPLAFGDFSSKTLKQLITDCEWMYRTTDPSSNRQGEISSVIWSDVFLCNGCGKEIVFWNAAIDRDNESLRDEFPCPHCKATVSKSSLDHAVETYFDVIEGKVRKRLKYTPVEIHYTLPSGDEKSKVPDDNDLALLQQCERTEAGWHPRNKMMFKDGMWGDQWRKGYHSDVTHDYHFYLRRPLLILSRFRELAHQEKHGLFWLTGCLLGLTRLQRYSPGSTFPNMIRSGTLYIGSLHREWNVYRWLEGKARSLSRLYKALPSARNCAIGTWSTTASVVPDNSVDYIFVDPPFGDNLVYSELNFLWEGWLRVFTQQTQEAIISKSQTKAFSEYADLMQRCFATFYKALKPGRWMTVVFHNSKNAVWNAIQEGLQLAGFIVADVRTIDKQQGSYNQIQAAGAVKKDLVISAYKPSEELERDFALKGGTVAGVWQFMEVHLRQLPVFVTIHDRGETIAERQNYLLYDRMVAYHVRHGVTVPMSASDFYAGLRQRYPERDSMYFLPDQASEYDRQRLGVQKMQQLELFVSDEKSAILWVRQQLIGKPKTYQELSPLYMKEAQRVWDKHEQPVELRTILEQNFIEENGNWHVPDPKNEAHLEQLRHRALMKEFQQYLDTKGKLKVVRTEALRAGFKEAWQKKDYKTIVAMAKRVPEAVVQEDPALLMYFDNASLMLGE
jgi:DNA modification methylase